MIEVEIKIPLFRRSSTEKRLQELQFIPGNLIRESDTYYTSDFHDFMKTDEALRIRQSDNLTLLSSCCTLTYKGPKIDHISMTRKELETKVDSPSDCREILTSLGYHPLFPVNKLRQYYHHNNLTACVDQVENLGSFLELEMLVANEMEREPALLYIQDILEKLELDFKDTTTHSYLWMLQCKSSKTNNE